MSNILWKSLLFSPAVLGAMVSVASAMAAPIQTTAETPKQQLVADNPAPESTNDLDQVIRYSKEGTGRQDDTVGQVTSVSQLRDVQPTDWAFQALQSLVERYGVIAGYPDGTFRGNQALTRYEFAAALNAALDRVNELISSGSSNLIRREDVTTLQRLQQEFSAELASIRGRVDSLEARTAQLEANQFSTTTKLVGEGIFAVTDNFGNYRNDHAVFQERVRLNFQTSFTGKDTLNTRLTVGNGTRLSYQNFSNPIALGSTAEGTQTFNYTGTTSTNNTVNLDWLSYLFPVFGQSQGYIAATGGNWNDFVNTLNPYFESYYGGTGALSSFADESPIYAIGGGAGAGLNLALGKAGVLGNTSLTFGYLADNANNPGRSAGFTNGDYAAMGQLNFNISDKFALAGTYVHGYHTTGSDIFNLSVPGFPIVGTAQANDPSLLLPGGQRPITTNSYGGEIAFRPSDKISFSGFVAETNARIIGRGDANIWTYGAGVAFPDFGKKGNLLGFFGGVEPTLRGLRAVGVPRNFGRRDEAWHFEGFYKYQLTDNISVTPGVIVLTAPGQNSRDNNAWIGTLRTTFNF